MTLHYMLNAELKLVHYLCKGCTDRFALDRLGAAQLEAIHGCCKGDSLPLNIRTAHRRRDCRAVR